MIIAINSSVMRGSFEIVKWGKYLYDKYLEAMPEDTHIILCPAQVGDTVWACALSEAYKELYKCRLMYVVRRSHEIIPELFPEIDYSISIDKDEMSSLIEYIGIERKWDDNHFIFMQRFESWNFTSGNKALGFKLSLYSTKKRSLGWAWEDRMGVLRNSKKAKMIVPPPTEWIRKRFKNSILLFPSSNSMKGVPLSFWERLGEALKLEGFELYVNSGGLEYDKELKNFQTIESSLLELVQLASCMKLCIGIRSGVFDLLAMTDARLLIVNPIHDLILSELKEYGVENMLLPHAFNSMDVCDLGREEGIWNYYYHKDYEDKLFSEIFDFIIQFSARFI